VEYVELRRVAAIALAFLGFATLFAYLAWTTVGAVQWALKETSSPVEAVGFALVAFGFSIFVFVFFWPVSTALYAVSYLLSRWVKSRTLAILFAAGGAVNILIGILFLTLLLFGILTEPTVQLNVYAVFAIPAILTLLLGVAFILAGRRRK
jgi:hydrogenase/urease accessory protein HupE